MPYSIRGLILLEIIKVVTLRSILLIIAKIILSKGKSMELILGKENITINGKTIPKIYGGFGDRQPALLVRQIAKIHCYEVKKLNQLINKNLDWFDKGIDYIDLKPAISKDSPGVISNDPSEFLITSGMYSSTQAIGGAKYIYLFSRQGYAMLCKLLKSDLAKQIYKQMIREYFQMVEVGSPGTSPMVLEKLVQMEKWMLEIKQQVTKSEQDICYLKKWLLSTESYLCEWENFFYNREAQKLLSSKKYTEKISPRQVQALKQKVREKGNARKVSAIFKKYLAIRKYSLLPANKWEEALKWIEEYQE